MLDTEDRAKAPIIRDKAFAKRLVQACEGNPNCPTDQSRGKQKWIYDNLLSEFGVPRTSKWVFHIRGKPLSENAMLYGLYALGYHGKSTVHGMRTSASTYLNEHEWNSDWIEMQLAHVDGSVRGVYNAALYLRQRREMLRAWSEFLVHEMNPSHDDEDLL